jgi:hypothetical protein
MMSVECNTKAIDIFRKYGFDDGQKHITQMIFLVEGINASELKTYWYLVEQNFKNLQV